MSGCLFAYPEKLSGHTDFFSNASADRPAVVSRDIPWFFPEKEDYQRRLEAEGFIVQSITTFERPTFLSQGIRGWLEMFAQQFTAVLPSSDSSVFLEDVIELCQPQLCDEKGNWIADYVRLRFSAFKPKLNKI